MYYAVIDTNVIVSAMLKARSKPSEIVLEAVIGRITPLVNETIIDEYNEVLRRRKFKFKEENITSLINGLLERAINVDAEALEGILFRIGSNRWQGILNAAVLPGMIAM